MSGLSERIAAEHRYSWTSAACSCTDEPIWMEDYAEHIAAVTEAAVREEVAREIEAALTIGHVTSYEGEEAARIARGGTDG